MTVYCCWLWAQLQLLCLALIGEAVAGYSYHSAFRQLHSKVDSVVLWICTAVLFASVTNVLNRQPHYSTFITAHTHVQSVFFLINRYVTVRTATAQVQPWLQWQLCHTKAALTITAITASASISFGSGHWDPPLPVFLHCTATLRLHRPAFTLHRLMHTYEIFSIGEKD